MPTTVIAEEGDSLCRIACLNGFNNCQPLRDVAENRARGYCDRALRAGEEVIVPDPEERDEGGENTQATHQHQATNAPPPEIRFVHGSRNRRYRDDDSLTFLNVSNFRTSHCGTSGTEAMPTTYGYNRHAHADLDTFKIEVVDPAATGNTLDVTLEARKPVYSAEGTIRNDADGNPEYEAFAAGDADQDKRSITVTCEKVSDSNRVRFRSRYMRLVVDVEDYNALSANNQALLTSDLSDGNNTANDWLEILDQRVRASYEHAHCPAPGGEYKCKIYEELEIGPQRQRIPISITVLRDAVGGAGVGGLTEAIVRKRTGRWFRRCYAQAELSPQIVTDGVQIVDPPSADMLVLGQGDAATGDGAGVPAAGTNAAGARSKVEFELDAPPAAPAPAAGPGPAPAPPPAPRVEVQLTAGMTPEEVGQAVAAALPADYAADVDTNARARGGVANDSCDVIIRHTDGRRVMIRNETTDDTDLRIEVARVDPQLLDINHSNAELLAASPAMRSVARHWPGTNDQLDFYICLDTTPAVRGRACPPADDWGDPTRARDPMRNCAFVIADAMDNSDNNPWSFPHEAGHVLMDGFHADETTTNGRYELMAGGGTTAANAVDATKRYCDDPIQVRYAHWTSPNPPPALAATPRVRARSTLYEGW